MRVGLTGGVASGKSTVAALLTELGAVVIDADLLAREVVEPGTPGLAAVVEEFGTGRARRRRLASTGPRSAPSCSATRRPAAGSRASCTR